MASQTSHSTGRRRLARASLAIVTSSALLLSACGFGGGGEDDAADGGLQPGDYTVASAEGVTDSVVVTGKIEPVRQINITSAVQSEVKNVAVKAGDRVKAEQFLVAMDTEQLERQLEVQQKQQANAQADAQAQAEQAQAQLDALRASINNGTHPGIRAAQAQVDQAQAAYNAVAGGAGPRLVNRGLAAAEQVAGKLSSHGNATAKPGAPKPQAPAPTPAPAPGAPAPGSQEAAVEQLLGGGGGGASAASKEEAYAALQNAQAELEAARTQAAQERDQLKAQAEAAWRQAETAQLGDGDGTLEYQVQEGTVYSPIAGLITDVAVHEGDIPQGKLLTVADDSRLVIRAEVRESDVPNISAGDRVEFTSTATGKKKYKGKVTRIAPAANEDGAPSMPGMQAGGGGGSQGSSEVTFPVEIEITGNKEGLLLGGSARAEIVTAEAKDALNVPLDAVYEDGDTKKVLVMATDGDEATSGKIEERTVNTGASNDVDIAVTGGDLKAGDIVVNWPDEYRERIGETVSINDPGFSADKVREARDSDGKKEQ